MAAYASLTDLTQLGLPTAALTEIDDATRTASLEAASSLADGYLAVVYALPLSSYGSDLTRAVVSIAVYDLMVRRGYSADGADEEIRRRYEDAIRWLEKVAAGLISPDIIDDTPDQAEGGSFVVTMAKRGW
jgi:phage gp36-like protein